MIIDGSGEEIFIEVIEKEFMLIPKQEIKTHFS